MLNTFDFENKAFEKEDIKVRSSLLHAEMVLEKLSTLHNAFLMEAFYKTATEQTTLCALNTDRASNIVLVSSNAKRFSALIP